MKTGFFPFFACLCLLAWTVACTEKKQEASANTKPDTSMTVSMPDSMIYTTEYYSNGKLKCEGHLQKGLRQGKWIAYSSDGRIMSTCEYALGRKNGKSEVYNPNGTLKYTGFYTIDEKSGTWVMNDDAGKKVKEINYSPQTLP